MAELNHQQQEEFIFDFIGQHPLAVLSTVSAEHIPASAAVYIWAKADLTCYFGTKVESEKCENILHNPNVALTISNGTTLETLQLSGTASVLTDATEVRDAMESFRALAEREQVKWKSHTTEATRGILHSDISHWVPPVGQIGRGAQAYIRVKPTRVRFRRYDADWQTGKPFTEYLVTRS